MAVAIEKIGEMVFQRVAGVDFSKIASDSNALLVLMEIDGHKTLAQISDIISIDLPTIKPIISKLLKNKIVDLVVPKVPVMSSDFYDFLCSQLLKALGPIAKVLIEDALDEMHSSAQNLPVSRIPELVDFLGTQIKRSDSDIAENFKQSMVSRIKTDALAK